MVPMPELWLPIVLSAVIVFIASSVMHMVLPYHKSDYKKMPEEDRVADAIRAAGPGPGVYFLPHCGSHGELNKPEVQERFKRGPVGIVTILPSGPPALGKSLALWFVYTLLVGFFTAYLAGRTLAPGTHYLQVFRVAGTAAFMAYSLAYFTDSVWKGQPWSNTLKHMVDGLIYGLLTAGTFGWLWPKAM